MKAVSSVECWDVLSVDLRVALMVALSVGMMVYRKAEHWAVLWESLTVESMDDLLAVLMVAWKVGLWVEH